MTSKQFISGDDYEMTQEEKGRLLAAPKLTEFQRLKLDKDSKKNWDLFYKRNGDRFFKNRYWTRNEFSELFQNPQPGSMRYLLEVGCGCGDFILPFLEDESEDDLNRSRPNDLFIYCCDISDQAIKILKENPIFRKNNPSKIKAFVADLTDTGMNMLLELDQNRLDLVSMIFVLSAVDPKNMGGFIANIAKVMKPGGMVLFRDYAINDKAMLRFSASSKICDQFYVRQDGTRAYFFSKDQLIKLFEACAFKVDSIEYIKRETLNNATKEKFSRIFLQAKFQKL